jgi:MFS family permease
MVDRYGVKWPYAISFFFWSIASAGTVFVRSISELMTLRVVLGVGEAVAAPASYRWIRYHFEENQRGLAVGLYMAGTKIGPAIGPPLAAWLIRGYDWRLMFLIIGLGGLVWLAPWLALVKDDRGRPPASDQTTRPSDREPGAPPVPFGSLLATRVIWGTVIATFCYMYFVYFCMTWMPAYFAEQRGQSLSKMGLYMFFSFGGMAIVAALGGWLADIAIRRGGNPVSVRKWFTIAGFAIACTELIGARSDSLNVAVAFSIVSLSGLGLATANYWAITQTLFPARAIGRVTGIQNCAASIAGIVAPLLSGWLKQTTGGYAAPMNAIWIILVIGILAYLFMVRESSAATAKLPA